MTAYLAGLAPTRCMEHSRAVEIDGTARAVLAAMAWPATEQNPRCYASHASIAKRSGFDRRTVIRAQERLAELRLIERVPTGCGRPTEWRLTLLLPAAEGTSRPPEGVSESHTSPSPDLCQSVTPPVTEGHTPCDSLTHNPSDLSRPQGREKRGRSGLADAPPSADAAGVAATPSTEQGVPGIVAEVMAARGGSQADAEAYISRKISQSSTLVKNETKYVRACLAQEVAPAPTPGAKAKGSAKKGKSATTAKPAPARVKRPHHTVRKAHVADVVAASRGGEPHDQLAERFDVSVDAVDRCRAEHDRIDGDAEVLAGGAPEEVAGRFPLGFDAEALRGRLQRRREREKRDAVVVALRRGTSPVQVAEDAGVDVDTVLDWRQKADELARRRRSAGLAA